MNSPAKEWMELAFVLLMLGPIAPGILWWKNHQLAGLSSTLKEEINRKLQPLFGLFLVLSSAVFLGLLIWGLLALAGIQPLGKEVSLFLPTLCAFHLLWWPFLPRITNRLNKLLEDSGAITPLTPTDPVRTANLAPRRLRDYLPPYGFPVVIALAVAGPAATLSSYLWRPVEDPSEVFVAFMMAFTGTATLGLWLYCMRFSLSERLPVGKAMVGNTSEKERRFRIQVMFWIMIGMCLTFYVTSLLSLETARGTLSGSTLGLIGGGLGAAGGIAGSVLGIVMSLRIHRMRKNLH